jgi:hypothetical protein
MERRLPLNLVGHGLGGAEHGLPQLASLLVELRKRLEVAVHEIRWACKSSQQESL